MRDLHEGGGRTVYNTLKWGGTEQRGGDTKIIKRRGKLGQGVGSLKRGRGLEPPYELWLQKRLKLATFR